MRLHHCDTSAYRSLFFIPSNCHISGTLCPDSLQLNESKQRLAWRRRRAAVFLHACAPPIRTLPRTVSGRDECVPSFIRPVLCLCPPPPPPHPVRPSKLCLPACSLKHDVRSPLTLGLAEHAMRRLQGRVVMPCAPIPQGQGSVEPRYKTSAASCGAKNTNTVSQRVSFKSAPLRCGRDIVDIFVSVVCHQPDSFKNNEQCGGIISLFVLSVLSAGPLSVGAALTVP